MNERLKRIFSVMDAITKTLDFFTHLGELLVVLIYIAIGYSVLNWLTKELPACK